MKAITLNKRIEKLGLNKNTLVYKILNQIASGEKKIHTCQTYGNGRFTRNIDNTFSICSMLDTLKVKYIKGNDAPRGGTYGNYIKVTTKIENN